MWFWKRRYLLGKHFPFYGRKESVKGKRGARQREGMDPGAQKGEKLLVSKRREAPKKERR